MPSFGPYLRELREARGVSLDEISEATRVARSSLECLEREDLATLPAPVFIRGFIRAYCETLGIPPTEAIARYEREVQGPAERPPGGPGPRHGPRHRRGQVMVSLVLLVVLGGALLALTTTLQGSREGGRPEPVASAVATSPATTSGGPANPSETPAGAREAAGVPVTAPPGSGDPRTESAAAPASPAGADAPPGRANAAAIGQTEASTSRTDGPAGRTGAPAVAAVTIRPGEGVTPPYRLTARTSEATWIRVRTEDGQHVSEEMIPAGQIREWVSNRRFALRIGNAGGVRLELNGRALPPLGRRGEVVERLVLPSGERP